MAVDGAGNVYVADTDNDRVFKLAPGSIRRLWCRSPAFAILNWVAVDSGGSVYLTDNDGRVLKLAVG